MKADLLSQIEVAQRRRRLQIIATVVAILIIAAVAIAAFSTKVYRVESFPKMAPAENAHSKLLAGSGIKIGNRFFLFSDAATIQFSYQGHISEERILTVQDTLDSLSIELIPMPKRLLLRTEPSVAVTWLVNEEFTGRASSLEIEVTPNVVNSIEALDFFGRSITQKVQIDWQETHSGEVTFDVDEWSISVTSTPEGAEILAGDQKLGVTPVNLVPGLQRDSLMIRKDGYETQQFLLSSIKGKSLSSMNVLLKKSVRSLPVALQPPGGELLGGVLNTEKTLFTPANPLPRKITYLKQGYVAETKTVTLATEKLSFDLKPANGELLVTSPVGGEVKMSQMAAQKIPARLKLPIGDATVAVSSDGFQSQQIDVSIFQDETTTISPVLEPIAVYRARTAKPTELAPHEIKLTKIVGEPLQVGASRSVKGQRANEILRDVKFTRHFYFAESEISEAQFGAYLGKASTSKLPVTNITWEEAAKYCNYLSEKQGLDPFYLIRRGGVVGWNSKSIGYRLPTEAEWEYVASKYTKRSPRIFVWGDAYEIPQSGFGNIADKAAQGKAKKFIADRSDGHAGLATVGFSNQVGSISDLSGNVSEWVHDYYSVSFPTEQPLADYQGPTAGRQHFIKGSNYLSSSWTELRSSYREPIDGARTDVGFRIARYVF